MIDPRFLQDFGYYDDKLQAYNIKASVQEAINLLVLAGAILASISAGYIGSKFGRRVGLCLCGVVSLIGAILQCASTAVATLYIGRIFLGGECLSRGA